MRDRPEFAEYVAARKTRLLRTAYLLCRDWGIAEDLVQVSLTKAWVAWPRVDGDPDAYVYRILVNVHNSWWRRRWRGEIPTADIPDHGAETVDRAAERDAVWHALARLGRRERAAVVLRYFEDLSHERIAQVLECSPGTVRSQISRALLKLRVDSAMQDEVSLR